MPQPMPPVSSTCLRQRQTQRGQKDLALRRHATLRSRSRITEHRLRAADSEDRHVRHIGAFRLQKKESMPKTTRRKFLTTTAFASSAAIAIPLLVCACPGLTQEDVRDRPAQSDLAAADWKK